MSGHNKWSSIKHKKGAADAKRGRLFTQVIKEITVAARHGGGDPDGNARLRAAILLAKEANMPKANIERAIKNGTGELPGVVYEEGTYEGYGPGGVAVIVEVASDNKNRTASELRHMFSRHGGSMGEMGCVAWMFNRRGYCTIEDPKFSEEDVMNVVLDAGAEDVKSDGTVIEVTCAVADFDKVTAALQAAKIPYTNAKITMIPQNTVVMEENKVKQMLDLMDDFENHEDVQNTYANFDIPEAILQKFM
jgi:YebC/PmpR family DNA-binding regulatory protein